MKVLLIGLGIQGRKRFAVAGNQIVATVDPLVAEATYQRIEQVPLEAFEAALVCTPDHAKFELLRYLLAHGKHVLVEKPLLAEPEQVRELMELARTAGVVCYTAYNHRFEPHIARLKQMLDRGTIGPVYLVRGFYGNGTARDVKCSSWRDAGLGVLSDLGSHLLDITLFLFGEPRGTFQAWSATSFENRAFDHVLFGMKERPVLELEATLLSWRNTFQLDVYGEGGSAHLEGLCKWGPSTLTVRQRMLPSGKPREEATIVACPDPTWESEYRHFTRLCELGGTNLDNDLWIMKALQDVAHSLSEAVPSS